MTEENKNTSGTPDPNQKGLPEGVTVANTGGGKRGDGAPSAPVVSNEPPSKPDDAPADKAPDTTAPDDTKPDTTEDKAPETKEDKPAEYGEYGDARDGIVGILKEAGIPVEESDAIFREAVEQNDPTKINVKALEEKLGKAKADLVLMAATAFYKESMGNAETTVKAVYEEVGGQANFEKVAVWARKQAETNPEFAKTLDGYNKMFDMENPAIARMAAKALKDSYEAASGNSSLAVTQVAGDGVGYTSGEAGISRADYISGLKQAYAKGDAAEVERLNNLRKSTTRK